LKEIGSTFTHLIVPTLKGNGRAKYFDLRAEEAITSNIPFYPDANDKNSTM